jgi:hypothetical protein
MPVEANETSVAFFVIDQNLMPDSVSFPFQEV